jgi:hypothetical protein
MNRRDLLEGESLMRAALLGLTLLVSGSLIAQEPPETDAGGGPDQAAVRVGLFGFGARVGLDLARDVPVVLSYVVDVGDLYTDKVRFRPSAEVGLRGGMNTYVFNAELMYRFTEDSEIAVPYLGAGIALMARDGCGADPDCPSLWAQFALGFELRFRDQINWLLEYRGGDALRRHRLFIGLVTRRGS